MVHNSTCFIEGTNVFQVNHYFNFGSFRCQFVTMAVFPEIFVYVQFHYYPINPQIAALLLFPVKKRVRKIRFQWLFVSFSVDTAVVPVHFYYNIR